VNPEPREPALAVDEPPAGGGGTGGPPGSGVPDRAGGPASRSSATRWIVEGAVIILVAVVAAVLLREFVVQTFYIPSGSMEPTLQIGDRIVVNKLSYELHGVDRGDIVVFSRPPQENCGGPEVNDLVKRVIALPGEWISLSGGDVYVNGHRLMETWLPASEQGVTSPGPPGTAYSLDRPYRVPANDYFVMGDNRGDSCDSRWWGPIPRALIVGKVELRVWPISSLHLF
jgi:signal peptidase I